MRASLTAATVALASLCSISHAEPNIFAVYSEGMGTFWLTRATCPQDSGWQQAYARYIYNPLQQDNFPACWRKIHHEYKGMAYDTIKLCVIPDGRKFGACFDKSPGMYIDPATIPKPPSSARF